MGRPRLPDSVPDQLHAYPLRLSKGLWLRFLATCEQEQKTPARVLRMLVDRYVAEREVKP